jgi:ABC-2 type transport system permease protein
MRSLFIKEINHFFGSLIGYIVLIVFLTTVGFFMWVSPYEVNVLNNGYATIDSLFNIAPWVFMFLIPAITMRSFADEKKAGTIELLLTKPLTDVQIILAKYFAGFVLVLFALLPTLIYFLSIYYLGNPIGNMDTGGTWGSYFGLLFLAAAFTAIGIFASSITENQIISFIVSALLCFCSYLGFEALSSFVPFGSVDHLILNMGMNAHYLSMSRGVIDTRDAIYFISVIALFVLFTKVSLESRKW